MESKLDIRHLEFILHANILCVTGLAVHLLIVKVTLDDFNYTIIKVSRMNYLFLFSDAP